MAFGMPNISYIGYPVSVPCAGHGGLGFREALRTDAPRLVEHLVRLEPADRRLRFCATLGDDAVARYVEGLWRGDAFVLSAQDGPLWPSALRPAGPVRAAAMVAIAGSDAEIGISVDAGLRRHGIGAYLTQTVGHLLAQRGVRRLHAHTLPGNRSMVALGRTCGAAIESGGGEVEITFAVGALHRAYLRRRLTDRVGARVPPALRAVLSLSR